MRPNLKKKKTNLLPNATLMSPVRKILELGWKQVSMLFILYESL